MKKRLAAATIIALVATAAWAAPKLRTARITTYCPYCSGNITASGTRATAGRTVAADRRYYKFGTKVWIKGYGYRIVEDTGGAVKGRDRFDVYVRACPGHSKSQKRNCWHGTGTSRRQYRVVK